MSMNLVTTLYLIASICFIQALKGLSHPTTSRRGNVYGMLGMALAIVTTIGLIYKLSALSFGQGGPPLASVTSSSACWSAALPVRSWPSALK